MHASRIFLPIVAALALTGMARKSMLSIRFHVEAKEEDGPRFSVPVKFANPPRAGFMSSIPAISERNIVAVYPVVSPAGTWGCAFKFDEDGRINLDTLSREHRGASLVVIIATKGGSHQVIDMVIDHPVTDGILFVPRGLSPGEIEALTKKFRVFGPAAATPVPVKKAERAS